jgi:hypothetical protein
VEGNPPARRNRTQARGWPPAALVRASSKRRRNAPEGPIGDPQATPSCRLRLVAKLRGARDRKEAVTGKCEGRKSYLERNPDAVRLAKKLARPGQSAQANTTPRRRRARGARPCFTLAGDIPQPRLPGWSRPDVKSEGFCLAALHRRGLPNGDSGGRRQGAVCVPS